MVDLNFVELDGLILKLKTNKFSDDELKDLIDNVFKYIKVSGDSEYLIKNLIEAMSDFVVDNLSNGNLTFDDYVEYVGQFKRFFGDFSGFDVIEINKYFFDYGLTDDFISFRLSLNLLACDDDLADLYVMDKIDEESAIDFLDGKIASLTSEKGVIEKENASSISSIQAELEKRCCLTKQEIISILSIISPEINLDIPSVHIHRDVDWDYVRELEKELEYFEWCSSKSESELSEEYDRLNNLVNSSIFNSYEDYKIRRKIKIISIEMSKRNSNDELKDSGKYNEEGSKFFGIGTEKLFSRLSTFMRPISSIDDKISKYKNKKKLFKESERLKEIMKKFVPESNENNSAVVDDKKSEETHSEEIVELSCVKIQPRMDLLYKSLAVICGFGLGLTMASCPGVGLFRMTLSGIKLTSSLHNVVKKKFPESLFSRFGNYVKEKLEDSWNNFSEHHKIILNFINNVNSRFGKLFANDIINYFINSIASGYFIGNTFQLLKMLGKFLGTVFDKFMDIDFELILDKFDFSEHNGVIAKDSVLTNGVVSNVSSSDNVVNVVVSNVSSSDNIVTEVVSNDSGFIQRDGFKTRNRPIKPFKAKPEVWIDDFSSVSEVVVDSVEVVEKCFFEIGDHINADLIEYGYVSSDSLQAVKLNTSIGSEVIVDKIIELSSGEIRVHLRQLCGDGFAWVDNEILAMCSLVNGRGR